MVVTHRPRMDTILEMLSVLLSYTATVLVLGWRSRDPIT